MKTTSKLTLLELGKIVLANYSVAQCAGAYRILIDVDDPLSVAEVGRQALNFGDIEWNGELN